MQKPRKLWTIASPPREILVYDLFIRHGIVAYENEVDYDRIITWLWEPKLLCGAEVWVKCIC